MPLPKGGSRLAWGVAAAGFVLATLAGIQLLRVSEGPSPQAGSLGTQPSPAARPAPDISNLTPREQADRLFDRIMRSNQTGNLTDVAFFTPMAVQAYENLGALDPDARYHLGLIHVIAGEIQAARPHLDSLKSQWPQHLFVPLLAAAIAGATEDGAALREAQVAFLEGYETEIATERTEYLDHQPAIDAFLREARDAVGPRDR